MLHRAGYYINWFGKDDALGPNAFKYIDYWEGMTENHMVDFLSHNTKVCCCFDRSNVWPRLGM